MNIFIAKMNIKPYSVLGNLFLENLGEKEKSHCEKEKPYRKPHQVL